jgi:hypothetical protein
MSFIARFCRFMRRKIGLAVARPRIAGRPSTTLRTCKQHARGGISDITRLLERIATSPNTESALREKGRLDHDDLQQHTIDYLKRAYIN